MISLKVNFDQEKMRMPRKKNANSLLTLIQIGKRKKKKKTIYKTKKYIYCKCRGQYDSVMVQCVACEAWPPMYRPTHSETNRREQELCL